MLLLLLLKASCILISSILEVPYNIFSLIIQVRMINITLLQKKKEMEMRKILRMFDLHLQKVHRFIEW